MYPWLLAILDDEILAEITTFESGEYAFSALQGKPPVFFAFANSSYIFLNFFCPNLESPTRPVARSRILAGSGTGALAGSITGALASSITKPLGGSIAGAYVTTRSRG